MNWLLNSKMKQWWPTLWNTASLMKWGQMLMVCQGMYMLPSGQNSSTVQQKVQMWGCHHYPQNGKRRNGSLLAGYWPRDWRTRGIFHFGWHKPLQQQSYLVNTLFHPIYCLTPWCCIWVSLSVISCPLLCKRQLSAMTRKSFLILWIAWE